MTSLLIDSDNALGSQSGDVDDAFAIAAILLSGVAVAAIGATAGNTSEAKAFANNAEIGRRMTFRGSILRGYEVAQYLVVRPKMRILALGPLTNIAAALDQGASLGEVMAVGGNLSSRGRWPPWWPHEFNLTRDRRAALRVFQSAVRITLFPLDVVRTLTVRKPDLDALEGDVGAYLRGGAKRWFRRLRLLKGTGRFPVYDLAAALYAIDPTGFTMESETVTMRKNTWLELGSGTRSVTVCRALDGELLWRRFRALMKGAVPESSATARSYHPNVKSNPEAVFHDRIG